MTLQKVLKPIDLNSSIVLILSSVKIFSITFGPLRFSTTERRISWTERLSSSGMEPMWKSSHNIAIIG
jgi:hypothetical protein